jgi:hypothetical protein
MSKFGGENDLTRLVIEQGDAASFASRIKLEPEWCKLRLLNCHF